MPCFAQTGNGAQVFSGREVAAQMSSLVGKAKSAGSSGAKLGDYSSHAIELSVRSKSGGAEVHAHFDDIFYVIQGRATLITGGTVLNGSASSDGESHGSGIRKGHSRLIQKGDIVNIPAGTPHQLKIAPGDVYAAIVVKVREPE